MRAERQPKANQGLSRVPPLTWALGRWTGRDPGSTRKTILVVGLPKRDVCWFSYSSINDHSLIMNIIHSGWSCVNPLRVHRLGAPLGMKTMEEPQESHGKTWFPLDFPLNQSTFHAPNSVIPHGAPGCLPHGRSFRWRHGSVRGCLT